MKRFDIVLLIRHPDIDPKMISEELKLEPYACAKKGEPRITPTGTPLQGVHDRSSWNHVFRYEGDTSFFGELEQLVDQLAAHEDFFLRMSNQGGYTELYLQLPGDTNQGSAAKPSLLRRMAELDLYLGVEVFPDDGPFTPQERRGVTWVVRE